jgi:hypothetical protein
MRMRKSKKLFILFVMVFALLLGYASYDIATRTTFPGSKPQLQERIQKPYRDSLQTDSLDQHQENDEFSR